MNAGDFFVRPTTQRFNGFDLLTLALRCTDCDEDVAPWSGPTAYLGGTTLAVLMLDAGEHVRTRHPGEEWNP